MKKIQLPAFTLIEVLLSTVIVSSILVTAFYAITYVSVGKVRLVESTKIQKEGFYFSEKLFEMIKQGWVLDYEEYFNRSIVWNTGATAFSSGHFALPSGYGNFWNNGTVETNSFWESLYLCVSQNGTSMGVDGCVENNNNLDWVLNVNYDWEPQRYGQYALQFIDYNSDLDGNGWDENGDWDIQGDDDDAFVGRWPQVFEPSTNIHELYMMSGDKRTRTYFRWNVWLDPDRPNGENCDFSDPAKPVGGGCFWTIEFLVLDGRDWWDNHDIWTVDANGSQYDGDIDTWIINSKFAWNDTTIAGASSVNYWESLFPEDISVSDFEVYAYPHKDINLAWKDGNTSINQAPYIRLKLTLSPSWKKRNTITGKVPQVHIATTIALTDDFSQ